MIRARVSSGSPFQGEIGFSRAARVGTSVSVADAVVDVFHSLEGSDH